MTAAAQATRTFPVIETFGPVIQGEGALAGLPTLFLRFGLCDYRCVWCDSKYAVEPTVVKRDAIRMQADELISACTGMSTTRGMWITLSGGNPAMHDLGEFVSDAQAYGYQVSVETQGSLWKEWLSRVDHLTVSPKPPSAQTVTDSRALQVERFFNTAEDAMPHRAGRSLKIVVFNDEDYEWARDFIVRRPLWDSWISVGTPSVSEWGSEVYAATGERVVRNQIGDQYAWLCERVAGDPALVRTRVLPQLHVVAFGHSRGV